jgi:PucR family transcriptional regulator, purine catabolism regulatory protein
MPLGLSELLAEPGLGLALVAGAEGLHTRGPVRWAHISEIPDPTPWLEGGELLLTTGLGVRDDEALQRRLVAGLDERGCAGIGFGVGVVSDDVPKAMLAEADARALPLFTVPYEVPFIAVTKHVSRYLADEHYSTLRAAVDLHRQVLASVLTDQGLAGVFATFQRPLADHDALLFDYYGTLLARHDRGAAVDERDLWAAIVAGHGHTERFGFDWGQRSVTGSAIRLGDQVEAVVALVGDRRLHDHEVLLFEQGLAGLSLQLARNLSGREARRGRVDELVDEIFAGTLGSRPIRRALERLGFDAGDGYVALCIQQPDHVAQRSMCALVEDALATAGLSPVVGRRGEYVLALVPATAGALAESIDGAAQARGWTGVVVGRSRVHTDLADLRAALREATIAVDAPGADGVRDIGALGLTGVLGSISGSEGSEAFVAEVLGPVIDYDRAEGAQLVESLRAYLRHGCRPGPAANDLRVHRHTLTYRLERITELTGRDPRDGDQLLAFALAIELHGTADPAGRP